MGTCIVIVETVETRIVTGRELVLCFVTIASHSVTKLSNAVTQSKVSRARSISRCFAHLSNEPVISGVVQRAIASRSENREEPLGRSMPCGVV